MQFAQRFPAMRKITQDTWRLSLQICHWGIQFPKFFCELVVSCPPAKWTRFPVQFRPIYFFFSTRTRTSSFLWKMRRHLCTAGPPVSGFSTEVGKKRKRRDKWADGVHCLASGYKLLQNFHSSGTNFKQAVGGCFLLSFGVIRKQATRFFEMFPTKIRNPPPPTNKKRKQK